MSEELKHCKTCGATMRVKGFDYCDRACFMTDPSQIKPNNTFTKEDVERAAKSIQDRYWQGDLKISISDAKETCTEFAIVALNAVGRVEE